MLRRKLLDAPADFVASREQDNIDVGIADQRLAYRAVAMNQVDNPGRKTRFLE